MSPAINRRSLLDEGRLQLAEFGLAHLFWVPSGQSVAGRNMRYTAPELFEGQVSRAAAAEGAKHV